MEGRQGGTYWDVPRECNEWKWTLVISKAKPKKKTTSETLADISRIVKKQ